MMIVLLDTMISLLPHMHVYLAGNLQLVDDLFQPDHACTWSTIVTVRADNAPVKDLKIKNTPSFNVELP